MIRHREQGNKAKAARLLGVDRRKLYRLLGRFEVGRAAASDANQECA